MSDTLAAYLLGQLEQAESIQSRRRAVWEGYAEALAGPAETLGLRLPVVPEGCDPAWHLFHVVLPSAELRPRVMATMREQGITTTFHYVPLHDSVGGKRFAARPIECPVTSDISSRLIRLPFYNTLTPGEVERVAETLVAAVEKAG
jgi:dTDP-4-amino-4,6-dideoxygalactose transaminase